MQVHRDYVITSGCLQHVCDQLCGDGRAGFVFLVLAGVGKVGNHGGDATGRGGFASIDNYEEFHQAVVDVAGGRRLEDKDLERLSESQYKGSYKRERYTVFISNRFPNGYRSFLIGVLQDHDLCELDTQPISN